MPLGWPTRAAAVLVLALHVVVGVVALALLPRGFALTDIHAWTDTFIPVVLVIATAVAIVRFVFFRAPPAVVSALVAAAAGGWFGAGVTGAILFPISMTPGRLAIPMAIAFVLIGLAFLVRQRTALTAPALVLGAALGALVVFAQRAPAPSTRPAGGALAEVRGGPASDDAAFGQIVVPCGKRTARVKPLLTFESRSPDRTWTVLAPPDAFGARRTNTWYSATAGGFRAHYTDDGDSTLVAQRDKTGALDIEAISKLPRPVYAHLDTFTAIHVSFPATIAFSPTAEARFAIEPADYPAGRPTQLAWLGDDLVLHVARAHDAEKGPFDEIARGRLLRDETLVIEIRPTDAPTTGCRFAFKDWASQVSTEPSPTAGCGVPQNSIQFFSRGGESYVILTLAETGPGRGYDSVGHAEGTYRNRLRVEPIR
jgi:hypothetical protein